MRFVIVTRISRVAISAEKMRENIMSVIRSTIFALAAVIAGTGTTFAQGYPNKPVTMVVPYSPGGSSDIMGRAVAQKLSEIWGQPVIVENRPGATTTVGAAHVARSAPDGYTMLLAAPPFVITQYVYPDLSYNSRKDFAPVSLIAYFPLIMTVPANSPIKSLKDLVEAARAKPGATYASPGSGTTPHLIGELMAQREKLDMVHVPYKSGGQGVVDLIAGRLNFYAGTPQEVLPHIRSGKLRALAVLGPQRSDQIPDVPTSTEAGFPYLQAQSWSTIVVPAGTPKEIVDKISADVVKVTKMPEVRERLTAQGAVFVGSTPEELAKFYEGEHERFGPLVKAIGLKPN
jgi:tripartite-type tricarboxylate transporter receptor subunit TctC